MKLLGEYNFSSFYFYVVEGETNQYIVVFNGEGWQCSCPSFITRGECKHIKWVKENVQSAYVL